MVGIYYVICDILYLAGTNLIYSISNMESVESTKKNSIVRHHNGLLENQ